MDDQRLHRLRDDLDDHQCWIKPLGWTKQPVDAHADFSQSVVRLDLARPSKQFQMDDVSFVYAVGHRQLCYIGRCNTPVCAASAEDIAERPERTRWGHWVKAINLTPILGRTWT